MAMKKLTRAILMREWIFLGCIVAWACLFLLLNLQNHYLWQDEAQTAVIARTVMTRGIPYGTDGENVFSQELGAEYGQDFIWKWHTWLPFYLVAGSFKLFGVGTFAARLPFALFGIAMVPLLYFFAAELYKDKRAAVAVTILFLSCVPFLILSRQCRYYSAAAFFSILGLFAYLRIVNRQRFSILLFIFAGVFLFHTHYIYCVSLFATVAVHGLIFHRTQWRRVGFACVGTILLLIPWIVWLSGIKYGERYGQTLFNLASSASNAISFIQQTGKYVFPVYLLLVPIVILFVQKVRTRRFNWPSRAMWSAVAIPVLFACTTVVTLSCTVPAPFFRYLCPVIPAIVMIAGLIVGMTCRLHYFAGAIVLLLMIAFQPITNFVYELTHDYDGPIEGIVKFLNANARPEDVVAITYGDMPLKFYTNLRVVGGLTGEDLSPARKARWVIIRRNVICGKDSAVRQYLVRSLDARNYRQIEIDFPDIAFENRESPGEHQFRTVKAAPRVCILERIQ